MSRVVVRGVYAIVNRQTGRRYIGSSVDIEQRTRKHREALESGRHENKYLQRAWVKYGGTAFFVVVVEVVEAGADLAVVEQRYIDSLEYRASGLYNIAPTAGRPPASKRGQGLGRRANQETIAKMSSAQRLRYARADVRALYAAARAAAPEKYKMQAARLKLKTDPLVEARRRAAAREANKARRFTPEQRAAIGAMFSGPKSAAHRANLSIAGKTSERARCVSMANLAKAIAANVGVPKSAQCRARISAALVARAARIRSEAAPCG